MEEKMFQEIKNSENKLFNLIYFGPSILINRIGYNSSNGNEFSNEPKFRLQVTLYSLKYGINIDLFGELPEIYLSLKQTDENESFFIKTFSHKFNRCPHCLNNIGHIFSKFYMSNHIYCPHCGETLFDDSYNEKLKYIIKEYVNNDNNIILKNMSDDLFKYDEKYFIKINLIDHKNMIDFFDDNLIKNCCLGNEIIVFGLSKDNDYGTLFSATLDLAKCCTDDIIYDINVTNLQNNKTCLYNHLGQEYDKYVKIIESLITQYYYWKYVNIINTNEVIEIDNNIITLSIFFNEFELIFENMFDSVSKFDNWQNNYTSGLRSKTIGDCNIKLSEDSIDNLVSYLNSKKINFNFLYLDDYELVSKYKKYYLNVNELVDYDYISKFMHHQDGINKRTLYYNKNDIRWLYLPKLKLLFMIHHKSVNSKVKGNKTLIAYVELLYKNLFFNECKILDLVTFNNMSLFSVLLNNFMKSGQISDLIGSTCVKCEFKSILSTELFNYCPKCGKPFSNTFSDNYNIFFE